MYHTDILQGIKTNSIIEHIAKTTKQYQQKLYEKKTT